MPQSTSRPEFPGGCKTPLYLILILLGIWFGVYCFAEKGKVMNSFEAERATFLMGILAQEEQSALREKSNLEFEIQQHRTTPELSEQLAKNKTELDRISSERDRVRKEIQAYKTSLFTAHP